MYLDTLIESAAFTARRVRAPKAQAVVYIGVRISKYIFSNKMLTNLDTAYLQITNEFR